MLASIRLDVFEECFFDRCRQHRVAVFVALACANHNFVARKIYIFDSKATTFHQSEARTIEQKGHHTGHAGHVLNHFLHFVFRQHDRQPLRPLGAHHAVDESDLFCAKFPGKETKPH